MHTYIQEQSIYNYIIQEQKQWSEEHPLTHCVNKAWVFSCQSLVINEAFSPNWFRTKTKFQFSKILYKTTNGVGQLFHAIQKYKENQTHDGIPLNAT